MLIKAIIGLAIGIPVAWVIYKVLLDGCPKNGCPKKYYLSKSDVILLTPPTPVGYWDALTSAVYWTLPIREKPNLNSKIIDHMGAGKIAYASFDDIVINPNDNSVWVPIQYHAKGWILAKYCYTLGGKPII